MIVCDSCRAEEATRFVIPKAGWKMAMLSLCKKCYDVLSRATGERKKQVRK